MSSLREELVLWRRVSGALDNLRASRKPEAPLHICPFCESANVHLETMSTLTESGEGLRIGFFTCRSCNESWSGLIH